MFSNVKHGWARFEFEDFVGSISYLVDPITEIGEILINGNGVARMDEEGSFFDIILVDYDFCIIERRDEAALHSTNRDISDIAKEFVSDVERDLEDWIDWELEPDESDYLEIRRDEIINCLEKIKRKYDI